MRMHIELDDELVARVDEIAGPRGRSAFVRGAAERAIREERRWSDIDAAAGAIPGEGHEWDEDPAAWVRAQRRVDARRAGGAELAQGTSVLRCGTSSTRRS